MKYDYLKRAEISLTNFNITDHKSVKPWFIPFTLKINEVIISNK